MASLAVAPSADSRTRVSALREALATRVVVADGAMGTMLQAHDPTLDDFEGLEGCNEILNVTRPDIVRSVHEAYFAVGVDCVETNTFGANLAELGEYDIADRDPRARPRPAPGSPARSPTSCAAARTARAGCSARSGPAPSCPTLGHVAYAALRDAYQAEGRGPDRRRRRRAAGRDHARTCCRPRRRSSAPGGPWPRPGATCR